MCGNIFYTFCSIESHVVFHLVEKPYKCDTCEQSDKTHINSQVTVHYINGDWHGGCYPREQCFLRPQAKGDIAP